MENANKVVTGIARLSYANLFKPKKAEGSDEEKYSVSVLIPKSDVATLNKVKAAIKAVKEDPASATKWGGKVPAALKLPLRDGDVDREDDPVYAGHYFFNCSSKQKPAIVDRAKKEITDPTEVYSGCYARVSVNLFAYNSNGNKGIGAGLNAVLKWDDGEPLGGGRVDPEKEFDDGFDTGDDLLS